MIKKFPIRIDPLWKPLLGALGARPDSCYVELDDGAVRVSMPWLFDVTLRKDEILDARPRTWPLWRGVGWRHNLRDTVAVIGSPKGVVEIELREPRRWVRILPKFRKLAVSLEDPDGFLRALKEPPATIGDEAKAA